MADDKLPHFDPKIIDQTLAAAQAHGRSLQAQTVDHTMGLTDGALKLGAQCISVTVQNGQVCLELPLGIGKVCLPVPGWVPSGTAAQACLDICTKFGFPCGVEVTVSVAGQRILQKGFGCSC
ncbi:MAG: hypothetical protein J0I47_09850 [Sphingomonas sp.]|uniref:hypothetical protein n=1 Tax=Sphingomonas sp. TaxID=28214 RepID=UPI001AD4D8F7|nr:hypothetical protein [Sphingomonas sp.]MBN8808516.1 hypothetical protein [Sphingomonas sp.]